MKIIALTLATILLLVPFSFSADKVVLSGKNDEINYSVGHQVGRDLVRQQVEVNPEVLLQGVLDATSGAEPLIPFEQMIDTLAELREKIIELAEKQKLDVRQAGEKFLAENASKSGIVSLESGLQYKVLQAGQGKRPVSGDLVRVSYSGRDVYNQNFGSTEKNGVDEPVEFVVDNVIPGWGEALKLMTEGAEWEIYLPHSLAFKDAGPLAGQTVIYKIKLHKVNP